MDDQPEFASNSRRIVPDLLLDDPQQLIRQGSTVNFWTCRLCIVGESHLPIDVTDFHKLDSVSIARVVGEDRISIISFGQWRIKQRNSSFQAIRYGLGEIRRDLALVFRLFRFKLFP